METEPQKYLPDPSKHKAMVVREIYPLVEYGKKEAPPRGVDASLKYRETFREFFRKRVPDTPLDAKVRLVVQAYREAMPKPERSEVAEALLRGLETQKNLMEAEGGHLSAEEVRPFLKVNSKQAVFDQYNKGLLVGWREKQNTVRFPVWQFAHGQVLQGIAEALQVFAGQPHLDEWAKVLFFLSPRQSLGGRRPLDLLREGEVEKVLSLARAYAE
jgi:hypothetical protein